MLITYNMRVSSFFFIKPFSKKKFKKELAFPPIFSPWFNYIKFPSFLLRKKIDMKRREEKSYIEIFVILLLLLLFVILSNFLEF